MIHQRPFSTHKILLNLNGQRVIVKLNEIQSVLNDYSCHKCVECMKRALKAQRTHSYLRNRTASKEMPHEVLTNKIPRRSKRDIGAPTLPELDTNKDKKIKPKKSKSQKSVTVTKYNFDGEVFALKVKEANSTIDDLNEKLYGVSCQVYSINKSYPCDSPEGDLIVTAAKRKMNKKDKKDKDITTKITTKPDILINSAGFRKRQVDSNYQNSQLPENVMPSIEEFY